MKKILICFVCLCLIAATFVGCGSKTDRRKREVLREVKKDKIELNYVAAFKGNSSNMETDAKYSFIADHNYLCISGDSAYVKKYVNREDAEYEILRTPLGGGEPEVICSVPYNSDFSHIIMIEPGCYYQYKIVGTYDDPAHEILGWATDYEYQWFKFYTDGVTEPEGPISTYKYTDKIYGETLEEMIDNFRNSRILSHLGRNSKKFVEADGIMSTLTSMTVENEHDSFEFVEIRGYNSETKSALLHCFYRVCEGYGLVNTTSPHRLDLIFLLDENGEIHYVGEYEDFMDGNVKYIVPVD